MRFYKNGKEISNMDAINILGASLFTKRMFDAMNFFNENRAVTSMTWTDGFAIKKEARA